MAPSKKAGTSATRKNSATSKRAVKRSASPVPGKTSKQITPAPSNKKSNHSTPGFTGRISKQPTPGPNEKEVKQFTPAPLDKASKQSTPVLEKEASKQLSPIPGQSNEQPTLEASSDLKEEPLPPASDKLNEQAPPAALDKFSKASRPVSPEEPIKPASPAAVPEDATGSSPLSSPPSTSSSTKYRRPSRHPLHASDTPTSVKKTSPQPASPDNGAITPSSPMRKRSASVREESEAPNPPIADKAESSKAMSTPRRSNRNRTTRKEGEASNVNKNENSPISNGATPAPVEVTETPKSNSNRRSKRQKTNKILAESNCPTDFLPPYVPATNEDKANWKGWIEIESEPAVFNVMLKEFGVQGIKVQEIYSLEDYFLALLPQPVYGLVFLFQYQDTDAGQQENPCPAHVWFANQVNGTNACASIALLNIVNNVAGIELGSELRKFKEDTITLSSEQRGQHLNKFVHVKSIHNSYARMIEMLEDDLVVEENYEEEERAKAAEAKRKAAAAAKPKSRQREGAATKKSKATAAAKRAEYSNDSAFHYVAFVPIHGTLYKLDGMDSHPQDLGLCDVDTWISIVAPLLQDRMTQFAEGGIHFALMALVKDPLIERQEELAANIALLQAIEAGLDAVHTDWRAFDGEFVGELLQGSSEEYGVSDEMIASVIMSKANAERLAGAEGADALLGWRKRVGGDQRGLKIGVMEEQRAAQEDQQRADERRGDWNPVLQDLLMCLEENGQADGLAEKHARPAKSKATSRGKGRR